MNISKVRKITITLSEREMNALEDNFFCELTREQYMKIRLYLVGSGENYVRKWTNIIDIRFDWA